MIAGPEAIKRGKSLSRSKTYFHEKDMKTDNTNKVVYREALIAAVCGALVAICFLVTTPPFWLAEEPAIAAHLALGHGFLSPLVSTANAIPTAMSPPLYSFLMAGVYKIFGVATTASLNIMLGLNVVSAALVAAGVYVLAVGCFNIQSARLAVALFVLNPVLGRTVTVLWHTYLVLALLIWILIWCRGMNVSRTASPAGMATLGVTLGIMALGSPTVVLAYPLLVILAIGKTTWGRWIGLSSVCFVAFCIVLTPWTIRNYKVFGRFFFLRDNLPLEFMIGNQPGASGAHTLQNHPSTDPVERARLLGMGENRYFDDCWKRFAARYKAEPLTYWRVTLRRGLILFVDPYENKRFGALRMLIDGIYAVLGFAGIWTAWRARRTHIWLFGILALCSFPYIFTEVNPSYTLPLRIALLIYGGSALAAWTGNFARQACRSGIDSLEQGRGISAMDEGVN